MTNNKKIEFPKIKNDLILRTIRGESVDQIPIWIHRQAGRYLPEFKKLRENTNFFDFCENKDLVCKATLQPLERYKFDAAIIFSDILVIPRALGMEIKMIPGKGPVFSEPLTETDLDLKRLTNVSHINEKLKYVFDSITFTRISLNGKVPLIGFSGAPWTLMAYMIEGSGSKTFSKAKKWLFRYPKQSHLLLQLLTDIIIDYLVAQVNAGAQIIELFDTIAEVLGPDEFFAFSLPYLKQIVDSVKKKCLPDFIPITLFAKGANYALKQLSESGCDIISIDWKIKPKEARSLVGKNITLQGNLDPSILYSSDDVIREKVKEMINGFGSKRYIVNLGHGMYPDHDPHSVKVFVEAVKSHKFEV